MRYWFQGRAAENFVQANVPRLGRYWFQGQPFVYLGGGTIPPPPSGSPALPTGLNRARQDVDEWMPPAPREFAAIIASIAVVLPHQPPPARFDEPEWFPWPRQRIYAVPAIVTVEDFFVQFII